MKWILCFFFLYGLTTCVGQQRYNQHNPSFTNSEVLWLKQNKVDFLSMPITNPKLINNAESAIKYRDEERKFSALTGVYGAVGVAGIAYGLTANNNGTFTSNGLNTIFGILGVISTSISVKYYLNKRKSSKMKKQHLEMCTFLSN